MEKKATYSSASPIEVVPRDENKPYSTSFANDDHDNIPKAGGIYDEYESSDPKRSHSMVSRRLSGSEDDLNQVSEQHAADARTPLVRDLDGKRGWKKGWKKIYDMGIIVLSSVMAYLYLPDRICGS